MTTRPDAMTARSVTGLRLPARRSPLILGLVGLAALVVVLLAGVGVRSVGVAPGDTLRILAHRLLGLDVARTWTATAETIRWERRGPRVLHAIIVGLGAS